jgi:hypothetical protein
MLHDFNDWFNGTHFSNPYCSSPEPKQSIAHGLSLSSALHYSKYHKIVICIISTFKILISTQLLIIRAWLYLT